ncbi:MAG: hypothetical protein GXY59_07220 [Bacteroidales bacterium]|nr:hypothetical protein [Bacteroidales bacterium]
MNTKEEKSQSVKLGKYLIGVKELESLFSDERPGCYADAIHDLQNKYLLLLADYVAVRTKYEGTTTMSDRMTPEPITLDRLQHVFEFFQFAEE